MKTYRTPGATATEWSPTGNSQEVQRMEMTYGGSSTGLAVPVTLGLRGETTKRGIRRVVLKSETTLPGAIINDMVGTTVVDAKSATPVSAHLVVAVPQLCAQTEVALSVGNGLLKLVADMISDLVAVATNESTTSGADHHSLTGLIASALAGAPALDIISGAYGESTART